MFLDRRDEFTFWRLSQDVVWEKARGSMLSADRFSRVHEHALHWYRGPWGDIHKDAVRERHYGPQAAERVAPKDRSAHSGSIGPSVYRDNGTRLVRSVIKVAHATGREHPTEKPVGIFDPLIRYACPPGGTVLDPFAGSGSTAEAARLTGRKAVLIEGYEPYCELIARRMSQGVLIGKTE